MMAADGRGAVLIGHPLGYPRPPASYQPAADFGSQAWFQAGSQASLQPQLVQVPVQLQAPPPLPQQPGSPSSQGRLQIQSAPLPSQTSSLQVQSAPLLPQATPVPSVSSQLPSQGSSLQLQIQSGPIPSQSGSLQVQSAPLPTQSSLLQSQSGMLAQGVSQTSESGPLQTQSRPLLSQSSSISSQSGLPRPASIVMSGNSTSVPATVPAEVPSSLPPESYPSPSPSAGSDHDGDDVNLDWVVWTAEDVGDFVDGLLGLGAGAPFRREDVDGPMLVRLTDEHLRDTMGIRDPLHRAKLLGHLRAFKARRERLRARAAKRKAGPGKQPHGSQPATPPSQKGHSHPVQAENVLRSAGSSVSAGLSVGSTSISRRPGSGASSVAGLTTFGQDTPSTSIRGSFSTASRQQPAQTADTTPGPCAYDVAAAEGVSTKTCSPIKATIGKSPRRTTEHFTPDPDAPGPSCYNVGSAGVRTTSPRAVIGNSVRKTSQISETDIGPGPCSYNVDTNMLRSSSPRATMGTSSRNTTEFIVNRDVAKAVKSRICRSTGRLPSPRGRNNPRSE